LAKLANRFNELPTEVDHERISDYLQHLVKRSHNTPSDSYFKFTVYALRFAYRTEGMKDKQITMPLIHRELISLPTEQEKRVLETYNPRYCS
jgi:integrase/recombinase XerD